MGRKRRGGRRGRRRRGRDRAPSHGRIRRGGAAARAHGSASGLRSHFPAVQAAPSQQVGQELDLRCGGCGRVDRYSVGTVLITDPAAWVSRRASLEEVWGFTGYLRCTACAAAGPWEATEETRGRVTTLALEAGPDPEDDRLLFGITATFDGTTVRLATEAEAHLRELIEASPEDAYLRDRLGNLYRTAGREDLAHEAYVRALGVDPDCLPALYSAGESFARLGEDDDRAADYLHRALEAAKDSPLSRADRKRLVEGTLYVLAELHERSEGRIDLFPPPEPGGEDVQDEVATVVVHLAQYDLDDPEDVGRLAETFL